MRPLLWSSGVLLVAGGLYLAGPLVARWYLLGRLVPRLGRVLGRELAVGRAVVGYRHAELEGLVVRSPHDDPGGPGVSVARVSMDYDFGALLKGRLEVREARVSGLRARWVRHPDGRSNVLDLLSRRRRAPGEGRLKLRSVVLEGGSLEVHDRQRRVELRAARLVGRVVPGAPSVVTLSGILLSSPRFPSTVSFDELRVSGVLRRSPLALPDVTVKGGRIQILPRLVLSGIRGTIGPDATGRRVTLALDGSYGGAEAKLWAAAGWVEPGPRKGLLEIKAARFSLGRIASILTRTPVILPQRTQVDGTLTLRFAEEVLRFDGDLAIQGLSLFHPNLARTPVLDLSAATAVAGEWNVARRELTLERLQVRSRGIDLRLSGKAERLGDRPKVSLRLASPPVPCQAVLAAFPPSLTPELQGFKLKGTFLLDLRAVVDYENLDALELGGQVGINRCSVVEAPEAMSAARLLTPFDHTVEPAPGQFLTLTVGPDNPEFAPFAELSPHLVNALLTTEDAGFFKHRGFITSQFRVALARNLKAGHFRLGASTISMQMVKNVLLTHEKTLARKLQELFLTWYVEQHVPKERIMELYFNAIEFGPGIYGIGRASRHYFGKRPKEITPLEAAFFATILPSPKRRYIQYCHGELSAAWDRYVRRVLRRIHSRGRIDDAAWRASEQQKLVFARDKGALSEESCKQQITALLDGWKQEYRQRLKDSVLRAAPHQVELHVPKD